MRYKILHIIFSILLLVSLIGSSFLPAGIPPFSKTVLADEPVSLQDIKTTLGLTDLGIEDSTLEEILCYPLIEGTILRETAEVITTEARYAAFLNGDSTKAALNLIDSAKQIQDFISKSTKISEILLTAVGSSTTWLGLASKLMTYAVVIPSIISSFETMQVDWIVRNYVSAASQAEDDEAWEMIRTAFGNDWFYQREDALYTLAQHAWDARYRQQEITEAARKLSDLIHQRVDIYKTYRAGQYTTIVTASPTTVIVTNNGEYTVTEVVLGNERPLFPDEVSDTYPQIAPGGSVVMSFVSGVTDIDYLEFKVLGAKARVAFSTSPVFPQIVIQATSLFGDYAPKTIQCDASYSIVSEGVTVQDYVWDFGDGSNTQHGEQVSHTYQLPGTYSVSLTIVTSTGNAVATQNVAVLNPIQPDFTVTPEYGPLSTVFHFDASGSVIKAGNVSLYKWDFSDGSPQANGVTVNHQYSQEGLKSVTLTVTNDQGISGTASHTISVGPAVPSGSDGSTIVGADAVWQRNLRTPAIFTSPLHLFDSFTVGTSAIWQKTLTNPSIVTTLSHIYNSFVVGANAVWQKTLTNPSIDTILSHIYSSFVVGANAVWQKTLVSMESNINQPTLGDANSDCLVDAADITAVERIIAGLDVATQGADANLDGNINALDITKVERIIAELD